MFVFRNNFVWGAVGVVKMYKVANVFFKRQSNQVPRIIFLVHVYSYSGSWHIFLCLKNRHTAIIAIFGWPKTHDTKHLQDFENFFLIHLTVIKNILNFKIDQSRKIFTFRQQQQTDDNNMNKMLGEAKVAPILGSMLFVQKI